MPCSRCNGQSVEEPFYDLVDDEGVLRLGVWRWASRCAQCGAVIADQIVNMAALLPAQAQIRSRPSEEGRGTFMMF